MICRPNHKDFELVVRVRSFFSMPDGGPKLWPKVRSFFSIPNVNNLSLNRGKNTNCENK